ncbi:MAG TPA: YncE family protein [Dermatophilaceae bacterium]|nr:YncE family protein [Dermatophilaceae bacterium]
MRRRIVAGAVALAALVGGGVTLSAATSDDPAPRPKTPPATARAATPTPTATATATAPVTPTATPTSSASAAPALGSDQTAMRRRDRITGTISPKSVVASPAGLVVAQNMMYTHTVTAYRPDGSLAATIKDSVDLADFGVTGHPGTSQGAPVEAAFTRDGKYAWVSNYSMYGKGFGPEGSDSCTPASGTERSFLYRVNTATMAVDRAVQVGAVPKYVAVTPDNRTVLVTNWCTWDLSIVDARTSKVTATLKLGRYPRGIAVSPDSRTAYIALMGAQRVVKVDLRARRVSPFASTGNGPRHIVISPDGRWLFVSNNASGTVTKVDARTGAVVRTVSTGAQPRSMAISRDGLAVYVVNYESSSVTKLRTSDLRQVDKQQTDYHPIGITYEPTTRSVWVACYGGSILVFDDTAPL